MFKSLPFGLTGLLLWWHITSWCSLSHTVIACPGNVKRSFEHLTGSNSDWRSFNRILERSEIPHDTLIKFLHALFEIFHTISSSTDAPEEFASPRRLRISGATQRLVSPFPHPIFVSFMRLLQACLAFWSMPRAISASFLSSSALYFLRNSLKWCHLKVVPQSPTASIHGDIRESTRCILPPSIYAQPRSATTSGSAATNFHLLKTMWDAERPML